MPVLLDRVLELTILFLTGHAALSPFYFIFDGTRGTVPLGK
jgi:hypothetical protein